MTAVTITAPADEAAPADSRRLRRSAAALTRSRESFWHFLSVSLSASVLVLVLAVATVVIGLPAVVGGSAMTVLTQSMEPTLPPGTLVVIRPTPVDEIRVGDVITYQMRSGDPAVVSHRVISKTYADGELTFLTKGDNNGAPDPEPVQPLQIRGSIWYSLPLLGWVNNVLNGANRPTVIAVAAGGLFLYAVGMTIGAGRERLRKGRRSMPSKGAPAATAQP